MKIIKTEINQKKNQKIQKIKFLNDNNYSLEFFNFGGYFHSINVRTTCRKCLETKV